MGTVIGYSRCFAPSAPSGGPAISDYFASGERGFWVDPSDFSTMYQTDDTSTPVTAAGQSVGRIEDKSGNGYVFTQETSGKRPTLQQDGDGKYYLDFVAASSQCLVAAATSASAPRTDSFLLAFAGAADTTASNGYPFSRSIAAAGNGRFWHQINSNGYYTYWTDSVGTQKNSNQSHTVTTKKVFSGVVDRVGPYMYGRINATQTGNGAILGDSATDITLSIKLRISAYGNSTDTGELAGTYFDGKIYGMVLRYTPTINTTDRDAILELLDTYITP